MYLVFLSIFRDFGKKIYPVVGVINFTYHWKKGCVTDTSFTR